LPDFGTELTTAQLGIYVLPGGAMTVKGRGSSTIQPGAISIVLDPSVRVRVMVMVAMILIVKLVHYHQWGV